MWNQIKNKAAEVAKNIGEVVTNIINDGMTEAELRVTFDSIMSKRPPVVDYGAEKVQDSIPGPR